MEALRVWGVPAEIRIRVGSVAAEIAGEAAASKCDLLVLGAPLPDREGKVALDGPVGQILNEAPDRVTLVIRSNHASVDVSSSAPHAK